MKRPLSVKVGVSCQTLCGLVRLWRTHTPCYKATFVPPRHSGLLSAWFNRKPKAHMGPSAVVHVCVASEGLADFRTKFIQPLFLLSLSLFLSLPPFISHSLAWTLMKRTMRREDEMRSSEPLKLISPACFKGGWNVQHGMKWWFMWQTEGISQIAQRTGTCIVSVQLFGYGIPSVRDSAYLYCFFVLCKVA